jgi:predicted ester cyclase
LRKDCKAISYRRRLREPSIASDLATINHRKTQIVVVGTAIAVRALLDGIPESIVIGVSLINGKTVSAVAGDKLQQFLGK